MELSFDDLKKEATRLEDDLWAKLTEFSRACAGNKQKFGSSSEPLLSLDHKVDSISLDTKALLSKLSDIIDRMTSVEHSDNITLMTIRRHQDLLQDYTNEYRKNLSNYEQQKQRENLFQTVKNDMDIQRSGNQHRRMDMYLKENEHIRSSDRLIDDQINIAIETREHLMSQRATMKHLQTRMHDISNRFPIINSLMQRIDFRKRKDSLVIGCTVFACTFLLLMYAFY